MCINFYHYHLKENTYTNLVPEAQPHVELFVVVGVVVVELGLVGIAYVVVVMTDPKLNIVVVELETLRVRSHYIVLLETVSHRSIVDLMVAVLVDSFDPYCRLSFGR